jgi:8-oxo-dGTP pyrophosphatase MutT (NUDIX family)
VAIAEHIRRLREYVGNDLLLVPSAAVVPRDEAGRILLVRSIDSGQWAIIGGAIEPDETPRQAARREAVEEAGVRVRLDGILDVLGGPEFRIHYPNGDETAYVSVVFAAIVVDGTPTPDGEETCDARWFAPAELSALDLSPYARLTLRTLGLLPARVE